MENQPENFIQNLSSLRSKDEKTRDSFEAYINSVVDDWIERLTAKAEAFPEKFKGAGVRERSKTPYTHERNVEFVCEVRRRINKKLAGRAKCECWLCGFTLKALEHVEEEVAHEK